MYQCLNLIFQNLKSGTNLYFPISFSNNRTSHKSILIFPLGTPNEFKQIIIKPYHSFNAYRNEVTGP